jgi:Protein of unknown function (DUF1579)
MINRSLLVVFLSTVLTSMAQAQTTTNVNDPTKTTYGEKDQDTPKELDAFSFLIGTWEGKGKTRLDDGRWREYKVTVIGRYILGGTAIADEFHAPTPDGKPYLGINLRHYDRNRQTWVVEYLNVSNSFLRKLVNSRSGSVTVSGRNVTVAGESPEFSYRERYEVEDGGNWVLRIETSTDGGENWNERQEIRFQKAQ